MRSFYVAVFLGAALAGYCILPAYASDVLVPSTSSPSDAPNLGLMPEAPSGAPASSNSILPRMPSDSPPDAPAANLPYTPAPATPLPPPTGAALPAIGATATQVMKLPGYPTLPPVSGNLPNTLGVNMNVNWNSAATKNIGDKLGIPQDKVSSICRVSIRGVIATNKGGSLFDTGMTSSAVSKYDGKITMVIVTATAFCGTTYPLPPNKGVVFQIGDSYLAPFGMGNCQPPSSNNAPKQMLVSDDASGQLQCQFQ